MNNVYTRNVKRGADLLDKERPGWRDEIDLSTLDLADDVFCILGQVYGCYGNGLSALWGIDPYQSRVEWITSTDFQAVVAHGLSIDLPLRFHKWQALQEAWEAELSVPNQESE